MHKAKYLIVSLFISMLVLTSNAHAQEQPMNFPDKMFHGLTNVVTGFIEIPKNVINISSQDNIFVGIIWGTVRGAVHGVSRTVVGGIEFLTSPIESGPYVTPGFVWERFSEDTRYFGSHYGGYWTQYGPLDDGSE